ncbi:trypsin-like peptidase domain-containing protein [Empedobacter brevis]
MNRIINPTQLQSSVVKIVYKIENGTGFFIANNIILTAYHLFLDDTIEEGAIQIFLQGGHVESCTILYTDEENDICLLKCNAEHDSYLPLTQTPIRINENWESYGYPYQGEQEGLRIYGDINQLIEDEKYDFILNCKDIESGYNYEGLSGAPIMSTGRIIGIALRQLDDKIGAISINKIGSHLSGHGIRVYREELTNEIPSQLEKDISNIISNHDVVNNLDKAIQDNGNWILLEGKPGTGKTVNVASFTPEENCIVLGKYFTKIPNDEKPKSLRISKENFFNWIEETISITITGSLPAKSNDSLEKRIELLSNYFDALNEYLEDTDKIGLFFIDGLDEITNLKDFLNIIPESLPQRVRIILSCISRDILPSTIKNHIDDNRIILVSPLELSQCEYFIQRKIDGKNIDYENIQKIAIKSEGHPLYLHYLIDYILNSEITNDQEELDSWIENIPVIGGNIENYYNTIWEDIFQDNNKLWICLILSQLRHSIPQSDLINILPEDIRRHYYSVLPKISHLIKGQEKQEIYHNSFKDYILKKVPLFVKDCNDIIVKFCEKEPNNLYSITNRIYHYSLSSNPIDAISNCNQNWADKLAINHVEPDLIISDIKNVIELSIDLKQTTELIRLLLLLQRVDFRYNSVLVEYAFEIALALIANKKFSQAIKYLVRRNTLLIGIRDAIHFLQHFYENEAYEEAEILSSAIEREYRKLLDKGLDGSGVHHSTFIVKAQTIILSGKDLQESQKELLDYLNILRKHLTVYDEDGDSTDANNSQVIQYIRDYCFAWNNAFVLRYFDIHSDIEEMMTVPKMVINETWAGIYATSLLIYKRELDNFNLRDFNTIENEKQIVQNIELLIENYGYKDENYVRRALIQALLNNTSEPHSLRKIMSEYLEEDQEVSIRNKNGVDFERLNYENLCLKNNCIGFLDDSEDVKIHRKQWFQNTWEQDLLHLIEEIHFLEGKAYYYKSSNQLVEKATLIKSKLKHVIESISFNFDFRSYWERSYQLPEQIFPFIFSKLTDLLYEFDRENLEAFLDSLTTKSSNQLGLYTEGFRKCLNKIIQSLILLQYDREKIIPFVELWESHVISGVQNRWERTEDLLKINEIYGILNDDERSHKVFQEMLNTSMGPSWYKESQVTLINTALENLKSVSSPVIQEFASLLDYASGEMTFQRYVKYNKEEFIGSLIQNNESNKALEYYKFEVLPPPNVLIRNAEVYNFDAPRLGDGYCLGARNINEASAVSKILETIKCNPYLKWGLCQISTINDDMFRYVSSYGEHIAIVLNEIELLNDGNIDFICAITSELIGSEYIDKEDKRSLLNALESLSPSNIKRLQSYLLKQNINWGSSKNKKTSKQKIKSKEKDSFDLFNDSLSESATINKKDKLKEGIELYRTERRSLWYNNWSKSTDLAKKNIKSLFENENSVLEHLKSEILNFDNEYWDICKELIWFLERKLNDSQVSEIYQIINEHFHHIIRSDDEVKQKYSWINDTMEEQSSDALISEFIIWHLNHPDSYLNMKAEETLCYLTDFFPPIIGVLFNECISNKPEPSTVRCSIILNRISKENPLLIKNYLEDNSSLIEEIARIPHLSIKKNLFDAGINLNKIGYVKLYEEIKNSIPSSTILTGEVFFEEPHLVIIQDIIDNLNSELLLNEEFCEQINQLLDEYCSPMEKLEIKKSDKYLRRSFYDEEFILGRYNYFIKHALNNAIFQRVAHSNIDTIYELIDY